MEPGLRGGAGEGQIVTKKVGTVLLIGIDRPKKLNGFSENMLQALAKAYTALDTDPTVLCGVLYGEGAHFTAGLELDKVSHIFTEGRALFPAAEVDPVNLRPPLRRTPLVAAVQGICYTLGIELMLAADIVIAATNCRFAQMEVRRGILANHGATIRMVERAGIGNALRYLLTGDEFNAETAYRLGFVQEVVPEGAQLDRALQIANTIASQAPLAVNATLRNVYKAVVDGVSAASAELCTVQRELMDSADAREGVRSFTERRNAVFHGK